MQKDIYINDEQYRIIQHEPNEYVIYLVKEDDELEEIMGFPSYKECLKCIGVNNQGQGR